jgi:hypothetical protein
MLRRLAICAAFATWCFLDTWVEFAQGESAYFARHDPLRAVVVPALACELALTLGLLAVWELFRRLRLTRRTGVHVVFLALCLVPLGIAAVAVVRASPVNLIPAIQTHWFWPAVLAAGTGPLIFAFLSPYRASRLMRQTFLWSWPVLAVVLFQAARETLLRYPASAYRDHALAQAFPNPPKGIRVVWIIFDELSQEVAFGNRPHGLALPNLERLKATSFFATAAKAPGEATLISMPGLILGEPVIDAIPRGPNNVYLRTRSQSKSVPWSAFPNVFDDARELGFNTALVGWYHPYGRLLNRSLTHCFWTPQWLNAGAEEEFTQPVLASSMWDRARLQLAALPGAGHLPGVFPGVYQRQEKIELFSLLLTRALEWAADPSIGLVLIHLPVPHPPSIYSPSEGALTTSGRMGYLDNVALADRAMGLLRRSIEEAGLWNQSAILVSADHGWRTSFWRNGPEWTATEEAAAHSDTSAVPFLLKLPGQTSGAVYEKPLPTVVTRRLIMEILRGRLADPAAIPAAIGHIEADMP